MVLFYRTNLQCSASQVLLSQYATIRNLRRCLNMQQIPKRDVVAFCKNLIMKKCRILRILVLRIRNLRLSHFATMSQHENVAKCNTRDIARGYLSPGDIRVPKVKCHPPNSPAPLIPIFAIRIFIPKFSILVDNSQITNILSVCHAHQEDP